jgi:hypothetical protein
VQQKGDPSLCLIKANMCSCGSRFATNTHNSETSDLSLCRVGYMEGQQHSFTVSELHWLKLHFRAWRIYKPWEHINGFGCLNHCSAGPHQLGTPTATCRKQKSKVLQIVKLRSSVASRTHLPHRSQVVFIGITSCIDNHTINLAAVAAK